MIDGCHGAGRGCGAFRRKSSHSFAYHCGFRSPRRHRRPADLHPARRRTRYCTPPRLRRPDHGSESSCRARAVGDGGDVTPIPFSCACPVHGERDPADLVPAGDPDRRIRGGRQPRTTMARSCGSACFPAEAAHLLKPRHSVGESIPRGERGITQFARGFFMRNPHLFFRHPHGLERRPGRRAGELRPGGGHTPAAQATK